MSTAQFPTAAQFPTSAQLATLPEKPASPPKRTLPVRNTLRADSAFLNYLATVPAGHTVEDLLNPYYWGHHAKKFKLHGVITCIAEDGTFDIDLRITLKSDSWCRMRIIRDWRADPAELGRDMTPLRDRFKIDHTGNGIWRVISKDSGMVLKTDLTSRGDAEVWLEDHMKQVFKA